MDLRKGYHLIPRSGLDKCPVLHSGVARIMMLTCPEGILVMGQGEVNYRNFKGGFEVVSLNRSATR